MSSIANRQIIFDPVAHKYTDNFGNVYTSVTTVIGNYHKKFDTKTMAKICARSGRAGNPKYAGKTAAQLEREWANITKEACDWGNDKHEYNETCVKESNGFFSFFNRSGTSTYTLFDVTVNPVFGEMNLNILVETGFANIYPIVFSFFKDLVENGWKIYSELTVYNPDYLISGMIDILAIKDNDVLIVDWKTNASDIRFESGYFIKDTFGNRTSEFKHTNEFMTIPGFKIPDSVGHKYSLQVSTYGHLCTFFGYNYIGSVIFHIRRDAYNIDTIPKGYEAIADYLIGQPRTDMVVAIDMTKESLAMCEDHKSKLNVKNQLKLIAK